MRLAITGTGMLSSVGLNAPECFSALCRGTSGNKPLQLFSPERYNVRRAYEIVGQNVERTDQRSRATQWLSKAILEAVHNSRIVSEHTRVALLVGTGLRDLRSLELWWTGAHAMRVADLHFGSAVQHHINSRLPVMTLSNACSASLFALGLAEDLLQLGEVDAVIVAGADSMTESMVGLLDRVSPLHPERIQPFEMNRRGVLLGEGAAALVLETIESAKQRGVEPLAWLRGVGMSCDASHETAPDVIGVKRAMEDAHRRANITPEVVDLILAHGTGTHLNDETEAKAIGMLLGPRIHHVMISALKGMIGHTAGASGLMSVVTAVECLRQHCVPPMIGLDEPMAEVRGFNIVANEARRTLIKIAQIHAFGFGGVNAVAIVEKAA